MKSVLLGWLDPIRCRVPTTVSAWPMPGRKGMEAMHSVTKLLGDMPQAGAQRAAWTSTRLKKGGAAVQSCC